MLISDHAPLSKGLLVLTGTASLFNILLSSSTRHFFPNTQWIQVVRNSKVMWTLSLLESTSFSTTHAWVFNR